MGVLKHSGTFSNGPGARRETFITLPLPCPVAWFPLVDLIVGDIACTSMVVVALVMVLAFLLLPKVVQRRRHRRRSDALTAIVMAALMVGLSAYDPAVHVTTLTGGTGIRWSTPST